GRSSVSLEFTLSRDIEAAANDVRDAISGVADRLPDEADAPEVEKADSDSDTIIWPNMSSTTMDTLELSDYADRYVVDRLSSLEGVAHVRIGGRQRYAMRVRLDGAAMVGRGANPAAVGDTCWSGHGRARHHPGRRRGRVARGERRAARWPHRIGHARLHPARGAQLHRTQGFRPRAAARGRRRLHRAPGRRGPGRARIGRAPRL